MPIDPLNNLSVTSVKTANPTSQGNEISPRQELPANGQPVPLEDPAMAGGNTRQTQSRQAEVEQAVSRLNEYVQNIQRDLLFSVDEESGRDIIRVVDSESGELVRQIPTEEVLAISRAIAEHLERVDGIILQDQA